jgi:NADP-dependent aldehyde dehydrogenase
MSLQGNQIIGFNFSTEGDVVFHAVNPVTGEHLMPAFREATIHEIRRACEIAAQAFTDYRQKSGREKADFLDLIAKHIEGLGDDLLQRCQEETGLPWARLTGEVGRTTGQLRLFASLLREGSWVNASIDRAQPDRKPLPKADIRSMQSALGPVLVFGASNFPLAFSVAGGDTVSALAAGCPVIVKAHPAHPGTCELIGNAMVKAAKESNMPEGVFSMVHGGAEVGISLVNQEEIKAIGFTGSHRAGMSIFQMAMNRKEPIPVYAEMGSVNPVFVFSAAISEENIEKFAEAYVQAVNLGVGQFCTNPGVLIIEASQHSNLLVEKIKAIFKATSGGSMLTEGIKNQYNRDVDVAKGKEEISLLTEGMSANTFTGITPALLKVDAEAVLDSKIHIEEIFGPTSLVILAKDVSQMEKLASVFSGQLTASLFGLSANKAEHSNIINILAPKVGRLIVDGFPTGVEVCHSMVHGGAFPATSFTGSTSVGTSAIYRFTKPICFQGFPSSLLPAELNDDNPLGIMRRIDGSYVS